MNFWATWCAPVRRGDARARAAARAACVPRLRGDRGEPGRDAGAREGLHGADRPGPADPSWTATRKWRRRGRCGRCRRPSSWTRRGGSGSSPRASSIPGQALEAAIASAAAARAPDYGRALTAMDRPLLVNRLAFDAEAERRELVAGLLRDPARIAPKYFYDELGCALYGAICRLPEYYPTRTEVALFQAHRARDRGGHRARAGSSSTSARAIAARRRGGCRSSRPRAMSRWISRCTRSRRALERLAPDFPALELVGVATDFSRALELDGDALRHPGALLLSRLEHRQLHAGGGHRVPRAHPPLLRGAARKLASHRRRRQEGRSPCSTRPTTMRWASPPPSTATRCGT